MLRLINSIITYIHLFDKRKTPQIIVTFIAAFVFMLGLVLMNESAYFVTNGAIFKVDITIENYNSTNGLLLKFRKLFGIIIIVYSIIASIIGLLGMTCGWTQCK